MPSKAKKPIKRSPRKKTKARKPKTTLGERLLAMAAEFDKLPLSAWKNIPSDMSINHDHYLYGARKVED